MTVFPKLVDNPVSLKDFWQQFAVFLVRPIPAILQILYDGLLVNEEVTPSCFLPLHSVDRQYFDICYFHHR